MSARKAFTSVVTGRNFITPKILGYYSINNGAAELSCGDGIFGSVIYGVTVVRNGRQVFSTEDNGGRSFANKGEAIQYIELLKKQ